MWSMRKPVDPALADVPEHGLVRAVEDVGQLDPQARQGVHVEEAAVVDVARRHPPMGQPVGLRLQQPVQRPEAVRAALEAVEQRQRAGGGLLDQRRHAVDLGEPALQPLGLLREAPAAGLVGVDRHGPQALGDREQLRGGVVVHGPDGGDHPVEDRRVAQRPDRQLVLVVPDAERALVGVELQLQRRPSPGPRRSARRGTGSRGCARRRAAPSRCRRRRRTATGSPIRAPRATRDCRRRRRPCGSGRCRAAA